MDQGWSRAATFTTFKWFVTFGMLIIILSLLDALLLLIVKTRSRLLLLVVKFDLAAHFIYLANDLLVGHRVQVLVVDLLKLWKFVCAVHIVWEFIFERWLKEWRLLYCLGVWLIFVAPSASCLRWVLNIGNLLFHQPYFLTKLLVGHLIKVRCFRLHL